MTSLDPVTESVRSGQRMALFAILANFATIPLLMVPEGAYVRAPILLIAVVVAVLGIVRMARGLGLNLVLTVLMAMLMLVPLVNLLILLIINARATAYLRAQGLHVGLLGAKRPADRDSSD